MSGEKSIFCEDSVSYIEASTVAILISLPDNITPLYCCVGSHSHIGLIDCVYGK